MSTTDPAPEAGGVEMLVTLATLLGGDAGGHTDPASETGDATDTG